MQITKTALRTFRDEFAQAVAALEASHNIKISLGQISFDSEKFSARMSVANFDEPVRDKLTMVQAPAGAADSYLAMVHPRVAALLNGRRLAGSRWRTSKGELVVMSGYNGRAPRFPFNFTMGGRDRKASADWVATLIPEPQA